MRKIYSFIVLTAAILLGLSSCKDSSSSDYEFIVNNAVVCRSFTQGETLPVNSLAVAQVHGNATAGTADAEVSTKLAEGLVINIKAEGLAMKTNTVTRCYELSMAPTSKISAGQFSITNFEGLIDGDYGSLRFTFTVNDEYKVFVTVPDYIYTKSIVAPVDNSKQPYEASDIFYQFVPNFDDKTCALNIANFHLSDSGNTDDIKVKGLDFTVTADGYHVTSAVTTDITASEGNLLKINKISNLDLVISKQGQAISGSYVVNDKDKVTISGTVFSAQVK